MKNRITSYHAKYFAYDLTRQFPSNDLDKLTSSLHDAQVDLNPHQVEAALFAFKSPLSNGAILADEVGLGKTIEAGIILSQHWAERKRKLLIICPANLRKQWNQELQDKFFIPSVILENKSFNEEISNNGNLNPFIQMDAVIICSFQFAKTKAAYLQLTDWNLVVIDEAHRLRNVYKPTNKIGNSIKNALLKKRKILLTATPLQNSILELYGLVSLIDDYIFGDQKSFKSQYSHQLDEGNYEILKSRLQTVCKRTLRRQVLEYINYTKRIAILEEFYPKDDEQLLYDNISAYLQRPQLYALPSSQRQLMTLILRKLLASSSYAIRGTLDSLIVRLEAILLKNEPKNTLDLELDFEGINELSDEWNADTDDEESSSEVVYSVDDLEQIKQELEELKQYRNLAFAIKENSKAMHLQVALEKGFDQLKKLGANQKALIFTESRRTQDYVFELLEANGYKGKVIRFNGVNNDSKSNAIYKSWLKKHKNSDRVTGSATADKRAALVDCFRDEATIMVATEAAAEGINLQFCSLIVNYDLPWNPQRIEQRIGRCHRYGQKFDVVVVNFLNKANAADARVYKLLDEKFRLFEGVFGSSDEVLGSIGNGIDFEKRIAQIYNNYRTPYEINEAFNILQEELQEQISDRMLSARTTLLENFDEAVREKLRFNFTQSQLNLNKFEKRFWDISSYFLKPYAEFNEKDSKFILRINPFPGSGIPLGHYSLIKTNEHGKKNEQSLPDEYHIYRKGHPLAQAVLSSCKALQTPAKEVIFDYSNTPTRISLLENRVGESGWLQIKLYSIISFEQDDSFLIACLAEDGTELETEFAERLFSLYGYETYDVEVPVEVKKHCEKLIVSQKEKAEEVNNIRNQQFFDEEIDKLDIWADDMKISLEKEIKDLDSEIKLKRAEAKKLLNLEAKIAAQRLVKDLEKKRSLKRKNLYEAQDEIDNKKEVLLSEVEQRLEKKIVETELFTIKWKIT